MDCKIRLKLDSISVAELDSFVTEWYLLSPYPLICHCYWLSACAHSHWQLTMVTLQWTIWVKTPIQLDFYIQLAIHMQNLAVKREQTFKSHAENIYKSQRDITHSDNKQQMKTRNVKYVLNTRLWKRRDIGRDNLCPDCTDCYIVATSWDGGRNW